MKKSILVLSFLGLTSLVFAQAPAQTKHLSTLSKGGHLDDGTTMEEWLYATKGYADDVSKGKDPGKEGYVFKKAHTYTTRADNTVLKFHFIEMRKKEALRAVIIQVEKSGAYTYYGLPVPVSHPDVMDSFKTQLSLIDGIRAKLLLVALNDYHMSKVTK